MVGPRPWSESKRKAYRKPYRVEMNFTTAAAGVEDLEHRHEQLVTRAKALGVNFEHGSSEAMPLEDLIPGSPTDSELRA